MYSVQSTCSNKVFTDVLLQSFPYWGKWGESQLASDLFIPPPRKSPHSRLHPPNFYSLPPTEGSSPSLNSNLHVTYMFTYNSIKTSFLAIVIVPALFVHTGCANFDFN